MVETILPIDPHRFQAMIKKQWFIIIKGYGKLTMSNYGLHGVAYADGQRVFRSECYVGRLCLHVHVLYNDVEYSAVSPHQNHAIGARRSLGPNAFCYVKVTARKEENHARAYNF